MFFNDRKLTVMRLHKKNKNCFVFTEKKFSFQGNRIIFYYLAVFIYILAIKILAQVRFSQCTKNGKIVLCITK